MYDLILKVFILTYNEKTERNPVIWIYLINRYMYICSRINVKIFCLITGKRTITFFVCYNLPRRTINSIHKLNNSNKSLNNKKKNCAIESRDIIFKNKQHIFKEFNLISLIFIMYRTWTLTFVWMLFESQKLCLYILCWSIIEVWLSTIFTVHLWNKASRHLKKKQNKIKFNKKRVSYRFV